MLKIKSHFSGFLYLVLECYTSRIAEKNKWFYFFYNTDIVDDDFNIINKSELRKDIFSNQIKSENY